MGNTFLRAFVARTFRGSWVGSAKHCSFPTSILGHVRQGSDSFSAVQIKGDAQAFGQNPEFKDQLPRWPVTPANDGFLPAGSDVAEQLFIIGRF
jgi:hypothetical protein